MVALPEGTVQEKQSAAFPLLFAQDKIGFALHELRHRARSNAHIIVFANEKGGVGKSTAAFHTCVALCNSGIKVAAIDLDSRQCSLGRALENREGTSRRLKIDFRRPQYAVVTNQSEAGLNQEVTRIGSDCDFVVIDVAGHDSPLSRQAMAMADTLVTPVNDSFVDLDLLGHFDSTSLKLKSLGCFSRTVEEIRSVRELRRDKPLDWVVVQNRLRRIGARNEQKVSDALRRLAPKAGFRLANGLGERVIYRELFPLGLTLFDLKLIPEFAHVRSIAREEMSAMLADLQLPVNA